MTKVLRLQLQSDPELGDDAPMSTYSEAHCGGGGGGSDEAL
ncbi:hypothetical protein [Nocardia pseudobrasiliensis]|uniref:Uncharacterized protein n=1 Tax=Nocardia pseudobrasiliensis TaxID=45979 RepID=A0A370IB92_9NOCA|nr:hypothetical protein [Nocardia pseudobrasiliensis]RDI68005.1 hypothetical protein DFR76_102406 [Nocardia pseudobrasiliensis]